MSLDDLSKALAKRGFVSRVFKNGSDAVKAVMDEASTVQTVGFGGSVTLGTLGLAQLMKDAGKVVLRHGEERYSPKERMEVMRKELTSDLFLLSANAITSDGRIVNIDGNGNRVAASIFGPKKVIFIVGKNKVVDGGVDDAIARIKRESCPKNCVRLKRQTPCAVTGECADCDSKDRICKVTVIMDRCPTKTEILVFLVDEDLGY